MIRVARMLSIKIPVSVLSEDPGDKSVEIVILEPPKPAPNLNLGSRILKERLSARE